MWFCFFSGDCLDAVLFSNVFLENKTTHRTLASEGMEMFLEIETLDYVILSHEIIYITWLQKKVY